jgi:hypothetical protein
MEENRIPKRVLYMNLGTTRLRGRPRNRWQDGVREDGRIVGEEGWQEKVHNRGMEEAPENHKESSNSAHANGKNEYIWFTKHVRFYLRLLSVSPSPSSQSVPSSSSLASKIPILTDILQHIVSPIHCIGYATLLKTLQSPL